MGAWLMRGAGCTWNDITDRGIDGSVERTRQRPIPSGQVSVKQALAWGIAQSLVAFAILLTFNLNAILLGILALLPVTVYPFAKRFTWWPQVFLGLAFNWGALLAWTAHSGSLGWPAVTRYAAGIIWTLFSDTPDWLLKFQIATATLMTAAITLALVPGGNYLAYAIAILGVLAMGAHLSRQRAQFDPDDNARLLILFRSNRNAGLIPLIFLAAAMAV